MTKTDTFTVNTTMKISELINAFCSKHNEFHFYNFIFAGIDLINNTDNIDKKFSGYTIEAVGFKVLKNEKKIVKYIKSLTVNNTPTLNITKYKLVVTLPSGQSGIIVRWYIDNIGKHWNWEKIVKQVFDNDGVNMFVNPNTKSGENSLIFYHELYLYMFARCLANVGVEYDTLDKLLNLVMVFFDKYDPNYNTKMTIINVLFGDFSGEGQEIFVLSEEDRDQNVIKAFEQFLGML